MTPGELRELLEKVPVRPWYYPGDGRLVIKDEKGGMPLLTSSVDLDHERAKATLHAVSAVLNRADLLVDLWALVAEAAEFEALSGPVHYVRALDGILANLKELKP